MGGQSSVAAVELGIAVAAWQAGMHQIVVGETAECPDTAVGVEALERLAWGTPAASGRTFDAMGELDGLLVRQKSPINQVEVQVVL